MKYCLAFLMLISAIVAIWALTAAILHEAGISTLTSLAWGLVGLLIIIKLVYGGKRKS